ncbi:hypothetical protein [Desulfosporosinus nitroreducens]|uniref:hypothetical protein n=1 Tax=Desulfosporosinus nitroreducens TaxID=2018668 RepID=UPI00207C39FA|nr:hypothetical protein [Desulfosporosinus nitroreducens]MCO1600675.1 hypothetical protein [Desulfosporosinus nitroreducens]
MRKKTLILIGTTLIIAVLISLSLLLRGSVKTIKHGYFPIQSYATIMTSYKPLQYDIDDYTITFSVPDATEVYVSSDMGNEMQFSTYLVNNELAFRGYIQLWKIKDLERFLSYSKSLSPFDFRSYKVSNVLKSEYQGFIIEWTAEFGQESISGKEYWLKINNTDEVVRISLLSDTVDFPNKLDNVIQQILDSLQIDVKYFI